MLLSDWLKNEILGMIGGVVEGGSREDVSRLTLVGLEDDIIKEKLKEYVTWYVGDSDELLNLYSKSNMIDYNSSPIYYRNKRSYFWCVSSTEEDVKRTHSGQPGNIVNTLVSIVSTPIVACEDKKDEENLKEIVEESNFWALYKETQLPMTLVEGWGCYKISWDLTISDKPYITYYRAADVDFAWKSGKVVGVIFKDWYQGKNEEKYLVTETRFLKPRKDEETGKIVRDLIVKTRAFRTSGSGTQSGTIIMDDNFDNIPELKNLNSGYIINDFDSLLATPTIIYKDSINPKLPGKSIFQNKLDLFDDLDQELSQQANCIGKSTPEELFNTDFLQRDPRSGLPIQPKRYDRKFTMYKGGNNSDGTPNSSLPVQTTQPTVDFNRYGQAVIDTMSQILSGIMSPATMGININLGNNNVTQRDKERVTIATRNHITKEEEHILKNVFNDLLCCSEYLKEGKISKKKYDISVKWSEFIDTSFEEKAGLLSAMLDNGDISPEMYIEKLYGDVLNDEEKKRELKYLKEMHNPDLQRERMEGISGKDLAGIFGGDE